jgi:hypothetical protein
MPIWFNKMVSAQHFAQNAKVNKSHSNWLYNLIGLGGLLLTIFHLRGVLILALWVALAKKNKN